MYTLYCAKERFNFKAAHFAVFGPYNGERLHGHNYYVDIELDADELDENLGLIVEFNAIKPGLFEIIKQLDEYILIPETSPYVQCESTNSGVEVLFAGKRYVLPREDVKFVPIKNISCEELAKYLFTEMRHIFSDNARLQFLKVTIEETRGQKASYRGPVHP